MGENEFREGMYKAIDKLSEGVKVNHLKVALSERIKGRIEYVKRKLSGCMGYSDVEKKARIEELNYVLCILTELEV